MRKAVESILFQKYPDDVVTALLDSYETMQENFLQQRWKPSELEGGFFVEAARRMLELALFGSTAPIGAALEQFHDGVLKRYENVPGAADTFRFHIPRSLKAIYNLRNKRGVGHLSQVNPNLMDSTYILATSSWVLSEFIRDCGLANPADCQQLVDSISQRTIPLIYEDDGVKRVLNCRASAREQVLLLLHTHAEPVADDRLQSWIEYKNRSNFRSKVLGALHKDRLIEYRDSLCRITPLGAKHAEELLREYAFPAAIVV